MTDNSMCANCNTRANRNSMCADNHNNVCDSFNQETTFYTGITPLPECPVTTMAYIPFQTNTTMYSPENALRFGTAFVDLNKPFCAYGGRC